MYESVGVEAPILLSYTHKNEWNTHDGLPTRCQRSAMGVSLIFVGVRQQNGCFDTHTFIQFSTYDAHLVTLEIQRASFPIMTVQLRIRVDCAVYQPLDIFFR